MARIMTDEAWKQILHDMTNLKMRCTRLDNINWTLDIDMLDYVSTYGKTYESLRHHLDNPGMYVLLIQEMLP